MICHFLVIGNLIFIGTGKIAELRYIVRSGRTPPGIRQFADL